MDRTETKAIAARINALLEEEFGGVYIVRRGSASFTDEEASFKFTIRDKDAGSKIEADFKRHAKAYGMTESDLGREIMVSGSAYTIVGLKPKNRKYPVIVRGNDNRQYKLPLGRVKVALMQQEMAS